MTYLLGASTRPDGEAVEQLSLTTGVSKSQVSVMFRELDEQVADPLSIVGCWPWTNDRGYLGLLLG
jgi:transposase-like protein